jgi:hypothetical protein
MTTNEPIGRAGIPRTTYAWRTGGPSDGMRLAEGCSFGYIRGLVQATR